MTANDIANMVEKEPYHTNLNRIAIAHFVRQQQAEIDRLLTIAEDFQTLIEKQQAEIEALKQSKFKDDNKVNFELTDEEIIKVYEDMLGVASARGSAINFARAILLKAQEK